MGFINAICSLGEIEIAKNSGGEFAEIDSFIQMPLELISVNAEEAKPKKLPGMEIRIWLDVQDINAEQLEVKGVSKIDAAYFFNGNDDERTKKRRYLFREPVGSAATWRFSPVYKLGAGMVSGGVDALLNPERDWRTKEKDNGARFQKLVKSTLNAFEERGTFSKGSVDLIMDYLEENVEKIADLWSEKRSSYLMIFSVSDGGRFLYPVEVPAFLAYFKARLEEARGGKTPGKKTQNTSSEKTCAMCGVKSESVVNFDKIFSFATFDKESFLPGLSSPFKVFPICQACYQKLAEGRNVADKKFLDTKSISQVRIYVIPELLTGNCRMSRISGRLGNFIEAGIIGESFLAQKVLAQDDEMILHFVFWEKNQSQERLLYMAEDVPPSRLRRLQALWADTVNSIYHEKTDKNSKTQSELSQAISKLRVTLLSLAGRRENDITFMSDWILGLIASLLSGEKIDVYRVKTVLVSYLQGLCADSEWVRRYSQYFARDAACIVEFLYRVNEEADR